jgi:osmotically-inducible protein OsmY
MMGYGSSSQYRESQYGQPGRMQQRRGPKGYQRSDDRIREEIYEQLIQREHLDAEEVTVTVKDGNVTLEGTVPERRMKHEIEDIADQCIGVKDVDNKIRVKREGGLLGAIFGERDEEQRGKGASGTTAGGASSRTRRE